MQTNLISFPVEELVDGVVYQAFVDGKNLHVIQLNSETILGSDCIARVRKHIDLDLSYILVANPGASTMEKFLKINDPGVMETKFKKVFVPDCLIKFHLWEIEQTDIMINGIAISEKAYVESHILNPWCWLEVDGNGYDFEDSIMGIEKLPEPNDVIEILETPKTPEVTVTKKDGKLVLEVDLANLGVSDNAGPKNYEAQYLDMLRDILENGEWVENPRTKVRCLTGLNYTIKMNASEFPALTTRAVPWRAAIKEMLCYMQGFTTLEDFHRLGVNTWDANCEAWNPIDPRTGATDTNLKAHGGDLGLIYGASAEAVGCGYQEILNKLKDPQGRYDRGIIWNFWNPAYFHMGCLRPCMMLHHFNVIGNTLHLTSYQRSQDVPLGGAFNLIQAWILLKLTAHWAGLEMGTVTLHIANAHIYENQLPGVNELLSRERLDPPKLKFGPALKNELSLRGIHNDNFEDFFEIEGYLHHAHIKFPFTA